MKAQTKKKVTISARVYRASTGKWEDLGTIATTSFWGSLWIKIKSLWPR